MNNIELGLILNNFHRFQNFRQFSNLFSQINNIYQYLIEKAKRVTLFWNLSRNPDKISYKIPGKKSKIRHEKNEKIGNSFFIREKMFDDFWLKF